MKYRCSCRETFAEFDKFIRHAVDNQHCLVDAKGKRMFGVEED